MVSGLHCFLMSLRYRFLKNAHTFTTSIQQKKWDVSSKLLEISGGTVISVKIVVVH